MLKSNYHIDKQPTLWVIRSRSAALAYSCARPMRSKYGRLMPEFNDLTVSPDGPWNQWILLGGKFVMHKHLRHSNARNRCQVDTWVNGGTSNSSFWPQVPDVHIDMHYIPNNQQLWRAKTDTALSTSRREKKTCIACPHSRIAFKYLPVVRMISADGARNSGISCRRL